MIHMQEHHWQIVKAILAKYPYTFYAFGSRIKGTQRPRSDLDICFKDPIPLHIQALIEEEFTESDLPFEVDLVDFHLMKPDFRKRVQDDLVLIQDSRSSS